MAKPYAVHCGYIYSETDRQLHFISFDVLCQLYKIPKDSAINWDYRHPESFRALRWKDYKHLFPKDDGQYDHFKGVTHD